jgi:hypothetical protein
MRAVLFSCNATLPAPTLRVCSLPEIVPIRATVRRSPLRQPDAKPPLMPNVIWGKTAMKKSLKIENPENLGSRLRCPHCGEYLYPADLETFALCCYCNGKIENNAELEDFVIDPMVRQWIDRNKNQ